MNYQNIQAQIFAYAQKQPYIASVNGDPAQGDQNFSNAIPFFVNLALEKIYRDVQILDKNSIFNSTLDKGFYLVPKPPLWNQTLSFYIGTSDLTVDPPLLRTPLFKRTVEFCYNFLGQSEGRPQFYADYLNNEEAPVSTNFIVAPVPDQTYYYQLTYEQSAPFLDLNNVNPTALNASWIMQKYPSLLFYAAYIEALRYMGKGDEITLYQNLYEQTVQSLNSQNRARNVDRTANIEKV